MGMEKKKKKNNNLVQRHNHHQISSFNLACCLRPPPPPPLPALVDVDKSKSWLPFLCHFTPRPQLIKSSLASSTSSSSQLLKLDIDQWDVIEKGPVSPKVGCMGQVRRNDNKTLSTHFSRMFYLSGAKGAKVEDYCSSGRQEEYVAETMDPPLPVPKRDVVVAVVDAKVDSLWKRRHRGADGGLETLNVQQLKMQTQLHLHRGFGCTRGLEA